MSETANQPAAVAIATTADSEPTWKKAITVSHLIIAVVLMCITIAGSFQLAASRVENRLVAIEENNAAQDKAIALLDLRQSVTEKKCEGYDRLIDQRNIQWQQINSQMASIQTSLNNIEERMKDKK